MSAAGSEVVSSLAEPYAAIAVDRGAHLVITDALGFVDEYTAGRRGTGLPRLRMPSGIAEVTVLSWPSDAAATTA